MPQPERDELWRIIHSRDASLVRLAAACRDRQETAEARQRLLIEAEASLAERERLREHLQAICDEREQLNRQLTEELAEREARVRKLRTKLDQPLYQLALIRFKIVSRNLAYRMAVFLGIAGPRVEGPGAFRWRWPSWRMLSHRLAYFIVASRYWMQIGRFDQYPARPIQPERLPHADPSIDPSKLPSICIVTPSYMQAQYLEQTMKSVLEQGYPHLRYVVQDGGSTDGSAEIIAKYQDRLAAGESAPDDGQAAAINLGFEKAQGDVMAWLNSDDLLLPGTLSFIGRYFAEHPDVGAVYGHRFIIDSEGHEVARWIMPPHENEVLRWVDYVPQETLFWRRALWEKVGGIDSTFQFALDWDLILRFQEAGAKIVRVPYFLGCFRIHSMQKTSAEITVAGRQEMARIRQRLHGDQLDYAKLASYVTQVRWKGALCARLLACGIRK